MVHVVLVQHVAVHFAESVCFVRSSANLMWACTEQTTGWKVSEYLGKVGYCISVNASLSFQMSAITVGCLEAYKTSVDITCDSVDSSIKVGLPPGVMIVSVCVWGFLCVCMCVYVQECVCVWLCVSLCLCLCVYVCMYVWGKVGIFLLLECWVNKLCVYVWLCVCVCVCVCVRVHVRVHTRACVSAGAWMHVPGCMHKLVQVLLVRIQTQALLRESRCEWLTVQSGFVCIQASMLACNAEADKDNLEKWPQWFWLICVQSMYALMAKCEELSKTMTPIYQIASQMYPLYLTYKHVCGFENWQGFQQLFFVRGARNLRLRL